MIELGKGLLWLGFGLASIGFGLSIMCGFGFAFVYWFRHFAVTWSELKGQTEIEKFNWLLENVTAVAMSNMVKGQQDCYVTVQYLETPYAPVSQTKEFSGDSFHTALDKAINFIKDNNLAQSLWQLKEPEETGITADLD